MIMKSMFPDQALEEERLGPRRQPYSGERQKRLAVQEAATALVCTLMPAIEPVSMVRCPLTGTSDMLLYLVAQLHRPLSNSCSLYGTYCLNTAAVRDLFQEVVQGCMCTEMFASLFSHWSEQWTVAVDEYQL